LIVFIGLILFLFAQKSPGMALCLIGVFMAIAAAVQASASGADVSPNPVQFSTTPVPNSGPLTKIAVILVLGGLGMIFLSRPATPQATSIPTEAPHAT
jgi:hypothetical protein